MAILSLLIGAGLIIGSFWLGLIFAPVGIAFIFLAILFSAIDDMYARLRRLAQASDEADMHLSLRLEDIEQRK